MALGLEGYARVDIDPTEFDRKSMSVGFYVTDSTLGLHVEIDLAIGSRVFYRSMIGFALEIY